jgi:hypothetical protein
MTSEGGVIYRSAMGRMSSGGVGSVVASASARGLVFCALIGIGPGCMTSQVVRRPAGLSSVAAINEAATENPPLEIDYAPGVPSVDLALRQAQRLEAADETQVNVIDGGGERRSIDGAYVRGVRVTNHTRGALQGLIGGVLIGTALGVAAGAASGPTYLGSSGDTMFYLGVGLGTVGGLAGALAGGYVGQRTVFVFDDAR